MMKLTTWGIRSAGSLWLTVVLSHTGRHRHLKSFCNHPLLARSSLFPCSWVSSSVLCYIALQVTCRFSVLISSIHRISISTISGSAAFRPAPSSCCFFIGSFSSASLCFFHSHTLFSSTLCICHCASWADDLSLSSKLHWSCTNTSVTQIAITALPCTAA